MDGSAYARWTAIVLTCRNEHIANAFQKGDNVKLTYNLSCVKCLGFVPVQVDHQAKFFPCLRLACSKFMADFWLAEIQRKHTFLLKSSDLMKFMAKITVISCQKNVRTGKMQFTLTATVTLLNMVCMLVIIANQHKQI